jgi:hypothetical protein
MPNSQFRRPNCFSQVNGNAVTLAHRTAELIGWDRKSQKVRQYRCLLSKIQTAQRSKASDRPAGIIRRGSKCNGYTGASAFPRGKTDPDQNATELACLETRYEQEI